MSMTSTPIATAVLPSIASGRGLSLRLALAALGVATLAVSAKLHVPMWPVPMTMQTFMVLVVGMTFGPRLGGATLLAYVAAGAIGLNVFSGTGGDGPSGLTYLAGPTGGYILGFVIAGWLVGLAAQRGWDRSISMTALAMTLGTAVIFGFGLAWMGYLFGQSQGVAWVLNAGLLPFLPGAALKIALAALVVPGLRRMTVGRLDKE